MLSLFLVFVSTGYTLVSQFVAEQEQVYDECMQDWISSGATQKEARSQCGIFLE